MVDALHDIAPCRRRLESTTSTPAVVLFQGAAPRIDRRRSIEISHRRIGCRSILPFIMEAAPCNMRTGLQGARATGITRCHTHDR